MDRFLVAEVILVLSIVGALMMSYVRRPSQRAVCVLEGSGVRGHVLLRSMGRRRTEFACVLTGLSPGLHGFHVHRSGDVRSGCASTGSHYNPEDRRHGDVSGRTRHRGDVGNVRAAENGTCTDVVVADVGLDEIVGRSIVLHADADDLGTGHHETSGTTGNAGARIACGVIGRL